MPAMKHIRPAGQTSPWHLPRPGAVLAAVATVEQVLADLAERAPASLSPAEADLQAFFAGDIDDLHAIRELAEAELGEACLATMRKAGA
jgi:hypothetical protein